jgi:SAM-dependent methyltransferase
MDWHSRFLQQATWTRNLRAYLFAPAGLTRAGLPRARRVLEVGCGTGAILSDLSTPAVVHGLDLDPLRLVEARQHVTAAALVCGNALALPYPSGGFDITFCHFLLLWVHDPLLALLEMKRVTCPGGAILALAEPDYNSRLDEPAALSPLLAPAGRRPRAGQLLGSLVPAGGHPAHRDRHPGEAGETSAHPCRTRPGMDAAGGRFGGLDPGAGNPSPEGIG